MLSCLPFLKPPLQLVNIILVPACSLIQQLSNSQFLDKSTKKGVVKKCYTTLQLWNIQLTIFSDAIRSSWIQLIWLNTFVKITIGAQPFATSPVLLTSPYDYIIMCKITGKPVQFEFACKNTNMDGIFRFIPFNWFKYQSRSTITSTYIWSIWLPSTKLIKVWNYVYNVIAFGAYKNWYICIL